MPGVPPLDLPMVWYATYKLSIFGMFANESKSVKCEFLKKFITLRVLLIDV